jgi:AcrR family transcriptional regulator
MTPETQKGAQTRFQIMRTAYTLFLSQGFHATSMRQISKQAGIALGGIYNHFATKEEIYKAVFDEHHPYHDILPRLLNAKGETLDALTREMARIMIEALRNQPDLIKLMFVEIVEFKCVNLTELLQSLLPQVLPFIQNIYREFATEMRPIPPLILMRAFFGLFFSFYMTDTILGGNLNLPKEFHENDEEEFVNIFLYGILNGDKK